MALSEQNSTGWHGRSIFYHRGSLAGFCGGWRHYSRAWTFFAEKSSLPIPCLICQGCWRGLGLLIHDFQLHDIYTIQILQFASEISLKRFTHHLNPSSHFRNECRLEKDFSSKCLILEFSCVANFPSLSLLLMKGHVMKQFLVTWMLLSSFDTVFSFSRQKYQSCVLTHLEFYCFCT